MAKKLIKIDDKHWKEEIVSDKIYDKDMILLEIQRCQEDLDKLNDILKAMK